MRVLETCQAEAQVGNPTCKDAVYWYSNSYRGGRKLES